MTRLLDAVLDLRPDLAWVAREIQADIAFDGDADERRSMVRAEDSELLPTMAEHISTLSMAGECPEGVEAAVAELDPEDVVATAGSWRTHLASVQGWLKLSHDLEIEEDAATFDHSLSTALGFDGDVADDLLLPKLADRLERAVALRDEFLAAMDSAAEGSATLETATREWVEKWEEHDEEDVAGEAGGPIHAEAETWPITQFVQYASDDELELSPSYQRADVWPNSDSQMLIESVLRGIPLPSIIILQRSGEVSTTYEVVDGKQRLTALLRFMARHPRALEEVKKRAIAWGEDEDSLISLFQQDYRGFKKMWKRNEQESLTSTVERAYHFPFPLRSGDVKALSGELEQVRGKYYCQIREVVINVVGDRKRLRSIFEDQSRYKVPVITYTQVTSDQIHEVFSLYNKQGKHLNAEEIRNALFHHLALVRGLLVTAGDSSDVGLVAPFLLSKWEDLASTPETLTRYGFGTAGYKRTKILSWVAAILVHGDGRPEGRSTANHINSFLKRVSENPKDKLRDESAVAELMMLLDHGLDAHAVVPEDQWATSFRNAQGRSKWQELQLVATLVAFCAARQFHGDGVLDLIEDKLDDLRAASERPSWARPEKTQSREQWAFIARVVWEMLDLLEVPIDEVSERLSATFGSSGLSPLLALHGS